MFLDFEWLYYIGFFPTWKKQPENKYSYIYSHIKIKGFQHPAPFIFYCSTSQHHVHFNPSSTLVVHQSIALDPESSIEFCFYEYQEIVQFLKMSQKIKLFSVIYTSRTSAKSPYLWKMQKNELKWPCETFCKWVKDPNSKKYGAYLSCTSVIYIIINILVMKTSGPHGLARKLGNSCF